MAKKEEDKKDKGIKKPAPKGVKVKKVSEKTTKGPLKSGRVKGPMGVGKGKKTTPVEKDQIENPQGLASKNIDPETASPKTQKQELLKAHEEIKNLPGPEKKAPETSSGSEKKSSGKDLKETAKKPAVSKKAKPRKEPAAHASKKGIKKASEEKKTPSEEKIIKPAAKKMFRKKADKEISAEEKMKLPNTSTTEDLKEMAKDTAKDLANKFLPDEESRDQIKEVAKSVLPDQEDVKKSLKTFTKKVAPDPNQIKEVVDKILPDEEMEELNEKAKKAVSGEENEGLRNELETPAPSEKTVGATLISEYDVFLFKEGKHYHMYKKFGAHLMEKKGVKGVFFAVWAPNAQKVSVIGDFNKWDNQSHPMNHRKDDSGIWEIFIPEAQQGSLYKYFIKSNNGYEVEKGDPFAFLWENPPNTASMVWDIKTGWNDSEWMQERKKKGGDPQPMSVYEMHLGSWKRVPEEEHRSLNYRELAEQLPPYLKEMGFTHVEFMPVMEHPFFGSWGYQITGYFAPSSRFGTPQDFMHLIDVLHQAGIGVLLDWVPSHFPSDMHGLHYFDGTFLYEHADKKKGFHPDWQSYIFNYGRNEVRSFLISNAVFWLDMFHADGLRVDAVASMLYLDYSRKEGEWEPNKYGGRENLEAISFLKEFNEVVYGEFPDIITIAEESTAWPMVSKPTYIGGLGFGKKWMMGWMHDTLEYFKNDPIHRKHHQNTITFSLNYAFSENFMLPLSHDEVVYGKKALWNKMPGDQWNKFANLRSLYAYMFAHPGTKLLFMGAEFAQISEWDHDSSLEWHLLKEPPHKQLQESLKTLNHLYKSEAALYEYSFEQKGFEWIDMNDEENSTISFLRKGKEKEDTILVICNFTPVPRENYRIGVPQGGNWKEVFNSDEEKFGGSNVKNPGEIEAKPLPSHFRDFSIALTLPPMAVLYLKKV